MNKIDFTFADTIAGYVTSYDSGASTFGLATTDDRSYVVKLTPETYAEIVHNLEETYAGVDDIASLLTTGRYLYVQGLFYPENGGFAFEAKHIVAPGKEANSYVFEQPDWWVKQVRSIAEFYLEAQFEEGSVEYEGYRTRLFLNGDKGGDVRWDTHTRVRTVFGFAASHPIIDDTRQETDTISRTVYGFATAYLLTGEDSFLKAAQRGTRYLQKVMAQRDKDDLLYWLHAVDIEEDGSVTRFLPSQFSDDYGTLPCYEQIYALAGPVQTYRITGDPSILRDAELTMNLFERCYYDNSPAGGYFSHLDPATFDPRAEVLGKNRARKNWNSCGDHIPAYLINLWLATGDARYRELLIRDADTIVRRFPAQDSPFVQERFFADWMPDRSYSWQQDRAVIGHTLKIAWNLMRVFHLTGDDRYRQTAQELAVTMPAVGMDRQRGGWYDTIERHLAPGQSFRRLAFHDRKAWWQQEQAILAYLILHGSLGGAEDLRYARESAAFYNAFCIDTDSGAVLFNVLAGGDPYLLGNERLKGSHSMGAYHSTELGYLATAYTNLLITKQPMTLYFCPQPGGFKDDVLRVAPDLLPSGSVSIASATVDGKAYTAFSADQLVVALPKSDHPVKVAVTLVPKA